MAAARVMVFDAASGRRVSRWPGLAIAAGLMVGVAESLFFALDLAMPALEFLVVQLFGRPALSSATPMRLLLVLAAPVLAGGGFAWLLRTERGGRRPFWRLALSGLALLVTSTMGVVVAGAFETAGLSSPDAQRLLLFRTAFVLASTLAALICTFSVAILMRSDEAWRSAALTAAVTGASYLVFLLVIDLLPGWHVGGGDKAMVRVAMLGNMLAGSVGGTVAFRLLAARLRT